MHSRYLLPRLCANFVISPCTDNRAAPDFIPPRWFTRSLSMQLLAPYYIAPGVIFIATSAFIFNTGKTEGARPFIQVRAVVYRNIARANYRLVRTENKNT